MSKNLEPGTTIPDFELPDENGVMHRLSELQGEGNTLVVHLSRGEHCPRERRHHVELLRFYEWCSLASPSSSASCRTPSTTSTR